MPIVPLRCGGRRTASRDRNHACEREEDEFWINATKVEALLGLGNIAESDALKAVMLGKQPPPQAWMVDAMTSQLDALAKLNP